MYRVNRESNQKATLNRIGTGSVKWDFVDELYNGENLLPMWVADMDWSAPQEVQEALLSRIQHPIFGYTRPSESLYTAILNWMNQKHDWKIDQDQILFSPGVVPSISAGVLALTNPGDKVMIQSPVYTPFFDVIRKNNRVVITNELILNEERFQIDFEDFETKLKEEVKLFILCSPHNPGGAVWTREELERIVELCKTYSVPIISDEIHADLALYKNHHIPAAKLTDNIITLMAPSKTFNIAGLQGSLVISQNKRYLQLMEGQFLKEGIHGINVLAYTAMEAAYLHGHDWLNDIISQIEENVDTTIQFVEKNLPKLNVIKPQASYLIWIDLRNLQISDQEITERLIKKGKLALEPGPKYGEGGKGFVRMNIGCSKETLDEGLKRLLQSFSDLQ